MRFAAYILGFLAAVSNGAANVAQRSANRDEGTQEQFSLRLIARLVRRPVWLAGIGAVTLSFVLQALGLGFGTLAAVEPLLVLELPVTLIGARYLLHERLNRQAWAGIATMTLATIALIAFLGPTGGNPSDITWWVWLIAIAGNVALVVALFAMAGRTGNMARRSALLGTAAGASFGLAAALTKGMTQQYSHGGLAGIFTSWELYMAFATGFFAMWVLQNAMNAGRLVVAQPGITLADPYVSIIWGAAVFGESMRGGVFVFLAVVSACVMTGATVLLARSPALQGGQQESDGSGAEPEASEEAEAS